MSIFETLDDNFACYAVVVAFVTVKGHVDRNIKDYFIVADHSKKRFLIDNGFHYVGKKKCYMRDMTEEEVSIFKAISGNYRMVLSNHEGRVYEQKKWSYKEYHNAQKEAAYMG